MTSNQLKYWELGIKERGQAETERHNLKDEELKKKDLLLKNSMNYNDNLTKIGAAALGAGLK